MLDLAKIEAGKIDTRIESVSVARNVEQGIRLSKSKPPLVIIVDGDALEVSMVNGINQIKEVEMWKAIPVIGLTTKPSNTVISEALKAGYDQVLTKPLAVVKLLEIIQFSRAQAQN